MWNRGVPLFVISVLVLWLNFSGHIMSTLPLKKFIEGEFPSERYVFSRLVYNLENGTSAHGGFMLRYEAVDALSESVDRNDYAVFKKTLTETDNPEISPYYSHASVQDDLVFPLWRGLQHIKARVLDSAREGSRWHQRLQTLDLYYYNLISQTLVALVNAFVVSLFVLWVARRFSPKHGWVVLGLLLVLASPMTFFGRSLWWMMWSWFLPFLVTLWGLQAARGNVPSVMKALFLSGLLAGTMFLKAAMGYEFVSTIMVSAMVPIVFYAVSEQWSLRQWFLVSAVLGFGCLVGFLSAIGYHWSLLESAGLDPQSMLQSRFEMRAHGGETLGNNDVINDSTRQSFWGVLIGYLIETKELSIPQIILMAPFFLWLKKHAKTMNQVDKALVLSIGVSFLGAVSMLLILKGHAYIHGYDIAIWMLPLNLLLFTFYALRMLPLQKH